MNKLTKLKLLLKPLISEVLSENTATPSEDGKTYYYSILLNSKNRFHAEVTDVDGNVIFRIVNDEYSKFMNNPSDLVALKKYLVKNQKINDGDEIIPEF
jgi:hypothetical protein